MESLQLLSFHFIIACYIIWFVKGVLSFFLALFHINDHMTCVREDLFALFHKFVH
ncbi:hypothetical protein NC651_027598 [Populus alba x Populus x berolinensis]|nr:hypothetical protein NC651_027598 [Populus alba x Populus x berolinensis]